MAGSVSTAANDRADVPSANHRAHEWLSRRSLGRGLLLVAAALTIGVALTVIRGVIPPVRDIWVPQANQAGGAVPAFWFSVAANLVFAGVLILTALSDGLRRTAVCWVLAILALGALLQALAYLDAAAAFHGPLQSQMQPTTDRLRFLALADAVAGILVLIATVTSVRSSRVRATANAG